MSAMKDAIAGLKKVLLLSEDVDRAGVLLSEISKELRDHDNRLVRLETLVEVAKYKALPEPESK